MKKIKTAIVGTGFMGKVHAENVRRLGNVEIAAVVGSRPETAAKFAESAGIPFATSNLRRRAEGQGNHRRTYLHAERGSLSDVAGGD